MKRSSYRLNTKRTVAASVAWCLLAQAVFPVFAVSTANPGYAGYVNQVPLIYTTPPDVNVMFTLDDSGSMQSDAIPDYSLSSASYNGVPSNDQSAFFNSSRGVWYPNMWGSGSSYRSVNLYLSTNPIARYMRSSAGNPLYYNPAVTYQPWPQAANNNARMAPADPTAVKIHYSDPTATSGFTTINLTVRQGSGTTETTGYWPATYYVYRGTTALPLATPNTGLNTIANFQKYEIQGSGSATFARAATRTDCAGAVGPTGCSRVEELQNFANWLQYYRNRRLMAKGGIGEAFARQGANLRAGFARIGASPVIRRGVRAFSGTNRTDFFNLVYTDPSTDGLTPLRKAMDDVGKYFQTTDVNNPWAESPGTSIGTEYACRRSFHILSTDGYWNSTAATSPASNNNDALSGATPTKPDGTSYTYSDTATSTSDTLVGRFTINPFSDNQSNTLSDVAAYYWRTDLRTGLANSVVPSTRDPAFWQHLSTFTIGFGISGSGTVRRTSDGSTTVPTVAANHPLYNYIGRGWLADQVTRDWLVSNKVQLTWSAPADDNPATGDDLIHASMVGRGRYFMANDPTTLAQSLASALTEVADQPLDQASVAADSPQIRAGNHVIQATFSPAKWSGRLYSFVQNSSTGLVNNRPSGTGNLNPDQAWEASLAMPTPANRNIFTSSGSSGTGALFQWASLTSAQRTALNNNALLVDYLRGSSANEIANGGAFRDRARYTLGTVTGGILGDIVNSSPIKGPDFGSGYDQLPSSDPGQSSYAAFRTGTTLDNLRSTIFLGANDGMLHAFNSNNGVERFAYVPNAVYSVPRSTSAGTTENKLAMLADPTYTHRFTVDGPPNVGDAYLNGSWKTILIGSFGAGARGIYAMDVTNPDVGTGFGINKFMWELTDTNRSDMGFVMSYPHIVRMRSGHWAAIFGNGYDSVNGTARLYIVDLATGNNIGPNLTVDTGTPGNNGLSQPNFIVNANREVTAIYAGDLKGNLWKFDVDSTNPSAWNVAFSGSPLFSAINGSGTRQPITVMPEISQHPNGGAIISFGTGKFFEASDTSNSASTNVNLSTQSLYGIWDKPLETTGLAVTTATRNTVLQRQTIPNITAPSRFGATSSNAPTWTTQRGWYMDLASGGERVTLAPQQLRSILVAVANTPQTDPCSNGGTSRIIIVDPVTGAMPSFPVIDTNGDEIVDMADMGSNVMVNRSGVLTQPIFQLTSQASTSVPQTGITPIGFFYRGQTSSVRTGGVELTRDRGDPRRTPDGSPPTTPCDVTTTDIENRVVMTAAQSNTDLIRAVIAPGADLSGSTPCTRKRISWRQLK